MLHKRFAVAAAVSVAALLPTMGSAQVVPAIAALIGDTTEEVSTKINSIAGNDAAIDGSIDIEVLGNAGSSSVTEAEQVTNNLVTIDGALGLEGSAAGASLLGTLVGTGAGSAALDLDVVLDGSASASSTVTETTEATSMDIGDVSATALGAVNSSTAEVSEVGGSIVTGSTAGTSGTSSAADYALNAGTGLSVEHLAANTGLISGNADINFAGNGSIGAVTTTAAGAINTSEVTANVTGAIFGDPLQP